MRLTREPAEGKPTAIDLELILGGDLDQAKIDRLREIASRCPVHHALEDGIRITHH